MKFSLERAPQPERKSTDMDMVEIGSFRFIHAVPSVPAACDVDSKKQRRSTNDKHSIWDDFHVFSLVNG